MVNKGVKIAVYALVAIIIIAVAFFTCNYYSQKKSVEPVKGAEETKAPVIEQPEPIIEAAEQKKEVLIQIFRYEFDKPEITITPETKVIWKNMDTRNHVILDKRDALQFRTIKKVLGYGDTFEYVFEKPGVYDIIEANFGINGKVIVANNLITGNVIKNLEVNGTGFILLSINIFVFTVLALVLGFYLSRKSHRQ